MCLNFCEIETNILFTLLFDDTCMWVSMYISFLETIFSS